MADAECRRAGHNVADGLSEVGVAEEALEFSDGFSVWKEAKLAALRGAGRGGREVTPERWHIGCYSPKR